MSRRVFGYTLFYGLGVGTAIFAMALLVPVLQSGRPGAPAGSDVTHGLVGSGAGACPYLESHGASPHSAVEGLRGKSICPYLAGRSSACPYLQERERAGAAPMPLPPGPDHRQDDGWFDPTPRPRTVALLQVEHPTRVELASAGWF